MHHVPGAISFDYLKTFGGVEYPTFKDACIARGLLNGEEEYLQCLLEAAQSRASRQLRALLVTILAYNCPGNVRNIWDQLEDDLIEDFLLVMGREQAVSMALKDIDEQLQKVGSDISKFDLPEYDVPENMGSKLLSEHMSFAADSAGQADVTHLMTGEQLEFYNCVLAAIGLEKENPTPKLFFLDAPAGNGKTFVENALIHKARSIGKIVLAVASSGIASLLLPHGTTAHSQFKIPIKLLDTSTCSVSAQSDLALLLKQADMIADQKHHSTSTSAALPHHVRRLEQTPTHYLDGEATGQ